MRAWRAWHTLATAACTTGSRSWVPVRADELEALVNASVRAGVPKLFLLDCCSSDCSSALGDWAVEAGGESAHDVAVYHAASAGRYGTDYITGTRLGGLSQCFADTIMRSDGIELNEARLVANAELRSSVPEAEPALDKRLDRPLVFWRAAVPGVRLRADATPSGMTDGALLGYFFGSSVGLDGGACLPVEHVFAAGAAARPCLQRTRASTSKWCRRAARGATARCRGQSLGRPRGTPPRPVQSLASTMP